MRLKLVLMVAVGIIHPPDRGPQRLVGLGQPFQLFSTDQALQGNRPSLGPGALGTQFLLQGADFRQRPGPGKTKQIDDPALGDIVCVFPLFCRTFSRHPQGPQAFPPWFLDLNTRCQGHQAGRLTDGADNLAAAWRFFVSPAEEFAVFHGQPVEAGLAGAEKQLVEDLDFFFCQPAVDGEEGHADKQRPGCAWNLLPVWTKGCKRAEGGLGGKSALTAQQSLNGGQGNGHEGGGLAAAHGLVEILRSLVEAIGVALAQQCQEVKGGGIAGKEKGPLALPAAQLLEIRGKEQQRFLQPALDQGNAAAEAEGIVVGIVAAYFLEELSGRRRLSSQDKADDQVVDQFDAGIRRDRRPEIRVEGQRQDLFVCFQGVKGVGEDMGEVMGLPFRGQGSEPGCIEGVVEETDQRIDETGLRLAVGEQGFGQLVQAAVIACQQGDAQLPQDSAAGGGEPVSGQIIHRGGRGQHGTDCINHRSSQGNGNRQGQGFGGAGLDAAPVCDPSLRFFRGGWRHDLGLGISKQSPGNDLLDGLVDQIVFADQLERF